MLQETCTWSSRNRRRWKGRKGCIAVRETFGGPSTKTGPPNVSSTSIHHVSFQEMFNIVLRFHNTVGTKLHAIVWMNLTENMNKYGHVRDLNNSHICTDCFPTGSVSLLFIFEIFSKTYLSGVDGKERGASTPWIGLKWFNPESNSSSATERSFLSTSSELPVNHTVKNIRNYLR